MDKDILLIVEDNVQNAKLLEIYFKKQGIKAITAEDGKKAVELFKEDNFLAVLMDIQLPKLNGLEAAKEMRKIDSQRGKKTPIIAVTAYAKETDKEKFLNEGLDGYVAKPIDFEELNDILNSFFDFLNLKW